MGLVIAMALYSEGNNLGLFLVIIDVDITDNVPVFNFLFEVWLILK